MNIESHNPEQEEVNSNSQEKNPEEGRDKLLLSDVVRDDVKKIKKSVNEVASKLPDDFIGDEDAEIWDGKVDKLKDAIRDKVGESLGINFSNQFLELPAEDVEVEDPDDVKELLHDIIGSVDYVRVQARNEDWLTEDIMSDLEDIAEDMETNMRKLLTQVDFADPNALVYGMKNASDRTRNFLWEQVQDKYMDKLDEASLEQVITKIGSESEQIAKEAWNNLRSRAKIEPIRLKRISDYVGIDEIESEAAEMLHEKIEDIEAQAQNGDEDAENFLENWSDIEELKSELLE